MVGALGLEGGRQVTGEDLAQAVHDDDQGVGEAALKLLSGPSLAGPGHVLPKGEVVALLGD
eukprot:8547237-Alexandrium_andersonii.AAC.1